MKFYRTNGLIYKTQNFQDGDKLVWILSEHNGKISTIAKGVRKINSRRAGHIDIFNLNKFSLHNGKSLDILTETTSINNFSDLKQDFTYDIFYLAEIIDKITMGEEESSQVYNLLIGILTKGNVNNFKKLIILFELQLLRIIGFSPNLQNYLDTDERIQETDSIYISKETPGFVTKAENHLKISSKTIKCMRFCLNQSIDATIALKIEPSIQNEISKINKIWLQNMLEMRIKSLEYLNLA